MSRILLLVYIGLVLYIWLNAISEFFVAEFKQHSLKNLFRFAAKFFFAPFWIVCVFSASGREFLFNWTKEANL